ncbi:MAG TPA: 5-amino-6-(D-ribitylamino)uracil--L-tyrosine 4-hydroxyphenyl transferase CofH [Methanocella sp.]|uniref:5-amino-6-(D-ribitylamino)uracil--L-tyrosine 4-hydroxyphenyl transferase CofH n=1 Tax=Methanocella sp. TaxID=2052833 RepID=UPI002BF98316|nr:5-amino-6-(D-ribitylamino)uracil--L-tyrosine 4-hydroxyphenyl transferase CofH [Methanocella sp.]HTY91239.1 5-amino-6-(D-ribitylamino)uracil--L-tyrosine 4-hydroxyphenyl transferase CofH [Methanocella sp.]
MLKNIYERSLAGEITKKDALELLKGNPFELFDTADGLRKAIVGDDITFVVNRLVEVTDRCMIGCDFCSFRNSIGFRLTTEEILQRVGEAKDIGATELCLISGVMPYMTVDYYCDLFKAIKAKYDIMLHALSPMEVYYAAKVSNVTPAEAMAAFRKAGLTTMTGASAEILVDTVREKICPRKVSTQQWVDIIKDAHRLGIKTTSTIMYGTLETWEDRIDHMFLLRDIQRETHGFTEFIPLTFMHENNRLSGRSIGASGMDDLRLHALARVIFGRDIPNIQVSWIKMGVKLSQAALCAGANDFGGTMIEDKISVAAGSGHGEYLSKGDFMRLIKAIDRIPRERTTLYERL